MALDANGDDDRLTQPLIDLHTHVLSGVDDGARDDLESLAMLTAAAADGISTIVATPHAHHVDAKVVVAGVARLNGLAQEADIAIDIVAGHEARIAADLVDRYRGGRLLTLNSTSWLLLECYLFDDWPIHLIARSVDRLCNAGLRPMLAHAERYPFVQRDPAALASLIERGIPIQINAGSLFLRADDIERKTAEHLISTRSAHVIASDAHNARYRPPALRAAYARAAELAGADYADWMQSVAWLVIAGADLTRAP